MSYLERADTIPLDDFAPHSADEDIRNLRELRETFRRLIEVRDISLEEVREKVRSLPGHRELKDTINGLLTNSMQLDFAVETIMDSILVEIADVSPPLAETNLIGPDSEPERSALYEDISDDELADMSTDEEDEEDRPPVARRLEFLKLRL